MFESNQRRRHIRILALIEAEEIVRCFQLFAKGLDVPHVVVWSPDGEELFYVPRFRELEAVSVTTQPTFAFGDALALARPFQLKSPNSRTSYDITPSGKFVVLVTAGQTESGTPRAPQIQVVVNWLEELNRLALRGARATSSPRRMMPSDTVEPQLAKPHEITPVGVIFEPGSRS